MSANLRPLNPEPAGTNAQPDFLKVVLRLVKGGPERRAIEAGQVDAILDPASGGALLLPAAQRWLLERSAQPDHPARATLDGLATEVCVLDAAGAVLSTNQAWRTAAGGNACLGAGVAEGVNYLAGCDRAHGSDRLDGLALASGIRQVIAGERKVFRYEHACDVHASRRWFTFNITPAAGVPGGCAIVSREDITERKRGEQLLTLEHAVVLALGEATDAGAALKAVIRAVCETQGWDCGRYFRLDPAASALHFHESWGVPTPAVEQFLEKSRGVAFHPGAGLKGRVYRSGQPLWIVSDAPDRSVAPTALALAPETDSDGAFIFPVTADSYTLGVLAFSGRGIREPDDRMLHAVRVIGSRVGRFLQRQQALDTLHRSEAHFRRLTELSTDWHWQQDHAFRYVEHTGTGLLDGGEVLGKVLWELPNIVPGSGEWETHRAQLGERWSFCEFEFAAISGDGRTVYYCISGEPVFDESGTFAGYRGTGLDITRRKQAELALLESEAQLRAAAGTPPP